MGTKKPAETPEELQERSEAIKKKLENRKLHKGKSSLTNSERKKVRKEKLEKKQLVKAKKAAAITENLTTVKEEKVKPEPDQEENSGKPVYNKEGKLLFSKVTIEGEKKKKGELEWLLKEGLAGNWSHVTDFDFLRCFMTLRSYIDASSIQVQSQSILKEKSTNLSK